MTLLLTLLIYCLFGLAPSWAVTFDTQTVAEKSGTGTTITQAHTVTSSGGNRLFTLFCSLRSTTVTVTATYAGVSMTAVRPVDTGTGIEIYMFYLVAPATGSNNWVATQNSALSMICHGLSFTNVNQVSPLTSNDAICASGTSATRTLSTTTNDILVDILALNIESASATPGAGQTTISGLPLESAGTTLTQAGSQQAGSVDGVMSYSWTGASSNCYGAISIAHSLFSGRHVGPILLD